MLIACISCSRTEERHQAALFCHECSLQHGREASRAISKVWDEIREGRMQPPTDFDCVDCGAPASCFDHRDYTKPLQVEPVCAPCNRERGPALDSQMRAVLPVTADQDMALAA